MDSNVVEDRERKLSVGNWLPILDRGSMNTGFAESILAILDEQPTIKREVVFMALIKKLEADIRNLPSDFLTAARVANKVSSFRRAKPDFHGTGTSKRPRKQ